MARKKKVVEKSSVFDDLSPHTKQAIGAVLFLVLGIYLTLSLFNFAGVAGEITYTALSYLLGAGAYLMPLVCAFYVYALMNPKENEEVSVSKIVGIALMFVSLLGLFELYREGMGGLAGWLLEWPLETIFGTIVTGVSLIAVFVIGIFLTFNTGLALPKRNRVTIENPEEDVDIASIEVATENPDEAEESEKVEVDEEETEALTTKNKKTLVEKLGITKGNDFVVSSFEGPYDPPPLSLLQKDRGKSKSGDVKASANIIKRSLKNFNIDVEMDEVTIGPSVTQYSLKPAEGVRLSKIVGLQNNLELALAASPIRIEAPIPGKSLVGIEVPNTQKATVGLASLLASPEYTDSPKPLLVALGRDITGKPNFSNLAKMPHCLIAGTTGSGKSVTIHALVTSLLFRNSPEQLRFIMVDPKRVELTQYNNIPHLLTPVITDAKKAILSLKWAIKEMDRRLSVLETEKVRDINSYHDNIYKPAKNAFIKKGSPEEERANLPEPMPYIVVIIDELADLMTTYPRELESSIVRLAQMSRAVGIHLVLSTQRPSVNVITGLIKANVPTRLALKVASQIDSRTILDQVGAEKLLGQGDMLFVSNDIGKPIRLQSAFITEEELKKVVSYLRDQTVAQNLDSINLDGRNEENNSDIIFDSMSGEDEDVDDDLYEEAKQTVIEAGKGSTSFIQRKLRIGYSRAARLMDILEDKGVVGPADGAKPREVLIGRNAEVGNNNDEES